MKRFFLFAIIGIACLSNVTAQDYDMCGIWSGTYTIPYTGQRKIVLRINKYNAKYRLRVKLSKIDNSDTYYKNNCHITSYGKNYIKWYEETPMEYDGEIGQYIYTRGYFSLYFTDGVLLYSDEGSYAEYYNRNKQFINRIDFGSPPYMRDIELFNEEDGDW